MNAMRIFWILVSFMIFGILRISNAQISDQMILDGGIIELINSHSHDVYKDSKCLDNTVPVHSNFFTVPSNARISRVEVNQEFNSSFSNTYTYDSLGNVATDYRKGPGMDKWKYYYTYDKNRRLVSYIFQRGGSYLVNEAYITNTFDSAGRRILHDHKEWKNGLWVNYYQVSYEYDINGNRLTQTSIDWRNGNWVNSFKTTMAYDSNNYLISRLEQNWGVDDWDGHTWRHIYTNDSLGNKITDIMETLNGAQWIKNRRVSYAYNSDGSMTLYLVDIVNNNNWENSYRYTYLYDDNENRLLSLSEIWENNRWINNWRVTYFYLKHGNINYATSEKWENNEWIPANGSMFIYDSSGNWKSYYGTDLKVFYDDPTEIATTVSNVPGFELQQNYPNPFNPSTKISYSIPTRSLVQLKVFDVLGCEVASLVDEDLQKGYYIIEFNASFLPSGIYFYRLQSDNFVEIKKLIVIK